MTPDGKGRQGARRLTAVRFARRLIARAPLQAILVGLVSTAAIAAGAAGHAVAAGERRELERQASRRYGTVAVMLLEEAGEQALPRVAGARRELVPIGDNLAAELAGAASAHDVKLIERTEGGAYSDERGVTSFIAIGPDDPATVTLRPDAAEARYRIAVQTDGRSMWHEVPRQALLGVTPDDTLALDSAWIIGMTAASRNVLVAWAPEISPFALAYELNERIAAIHPALRAVAWPEEVGVARYAAPTAAELVRPLLLAIAAAAVAGITVVAARSRAGDIAVLRTIGYDTAFIRRAYLYECAIASAGAALLVLGSLVAATAVGVPNLLDAPVRRTIAAGALLPPLSAFVVLRTATSVPLIVLKRDAGA